MSIVSENEYKVATICKNKTIFFKNHIKILFFI